MGSCSVLDIATSGDLLPHVYCTKITLENAFPWDYYHQNLPEAGSPMPIKATLNLELLQSKNDLTKSTWLNSLQVDGKNILDHMFIQVVPFHDISNIKKLEPDFAVNSSASPGATSYGATEYTADSPGNVYAVSGHPNYRDLLGNNLSYFPVGRLVDDTGDLISAADLGVMFSGDSAFEVIGANLAGWTTFTPIQISIGSLLGNITNTGLLDLFPSLEGDQISAREEIIDGKPYYAIPFEYTYFYQPPANNILNLGFLFYPFINTAGLLSGHSSLLNANLLTGPVNTEIIFKNGSVHTTRKQFFTPNGQPWHGAAHLHTCGVNPDPSGYCGDGQVSSGVSGYRGWMAGGQHVPNAPKLKLMRSPNYKIQDFRHSFFSEPADQILGYGVETGVFNQALTSGWSDPTNPNVMEDIVSPFQKETRKYLAKFDGRTFSSLYDNDTEYSKLYITRGKDNSARGLFMINFESLLENNSPLYGSLKKDTNDAESMKDLIRGCLTDSKLIELKVYRDRVKKKTLGRRYENFANDTADEEPSYLVGTYGDDSGSNNVSLINTKMTKYDNLLGSNVQRIRAYTFRDLDVGNMPAGNYQYRVEMIFKDGTYDFLNRHLNALQVARARLQQYYDLSLKTFNKEKDETKKKNYVPYFQNGKYVSISSDLDPDGNIETRFHHDAIQLFGGGQFPGQSADDAPWKDSMSLTEPTAVGQLQSLTNFFLLKDFKAITSPSLLISPKVGSPKGIELVLRLADTIANRLNALLGKTKINNSKTQLSSGEAPNGYGLSNFFDSVISPSDALIEEHHSFDHPEEIHKALANEDIYIDYLSIGPPVSDTFQGLRKVNKAIYFSRCHLDARKLTPIGLDSGISISPSTSEESDFLDRTGYTYLTPSTIEISDPSQQNTVFNFNLVSFNQSLEIIDNNLQDYDTVLAGLTTYGMEKSEVDDADLMPNYYRPSFAERQKIQQLSNQSPAEQEQREYYKNIFSMNGITIHKASAHDNFFDNLPGAISPAPANSLPAQYGPHQYTGYTMPKEDIDGESTKDSLLPEVPGDFTDLDVLSTPYYKKLFFKNKLFNTPTAKHWKEPEYSNQLPNIYKLPLSVQSNLGEDDKFNSTFLQAFIPNGAFADTTKDSNSYFFVNGNLLSEVQVYTGPSGDGMNMKNDEQSWKKITKNTLDAMGNGSVLLCRTVLYDSDAAQGLNLPVINKYFLINQSS